jgi:hypothetical protein
MNGSFRVQLLLIFRDNTGYGRTLYCRVSRACKNEGYPCGGRRLAAVAGRIAAHGGDSVLE